MARFSASAKFFPAPDPTVSFRIDHIRNGSVFRTDRYQILLITLWDHLTLLSYKRRKQVLKVAKNGQRATIMATNMHAPGHQ
ncbi:hypothetical protein PHPALM_27943 [Phytophthora palmivora]|uniref:Uncharacterized protein n=1 Tax=Phytophthora palmivora TaxID=4796 RepID=A0A2P4XBC4_9STRA|nr:hypothetical protein PHPALM_27943 [Phytophthora palmivora]